MIGCTACVAAAFQEKNFPSVLPRSQSGMTEKKRRKPESRRPQKICFCRLRQLQGKRRMFPDRKGGCPPAAEDGTTGNRAARREALNSRGGTPKKDASPPPPGCGTMLQNAGRSDHGLTPASPCFYSPRPTLPAMPGRHAGKRRENACRKSARDETTWPADSSVVPPQVLGRTARPPGRAPPHRVRTTQ